MAESARSYTKTLKIGDVAPDFTLKSHVREDWHLANFRGKKNVVLAFVPFAFSRVCSAQLPSYERELERFRSADTEVVAISMDSVYALDAWSQAMRTSFPLLSDFYPQGAVVDLYGVRHPAGMAERAVILIDKEGIIRHIEVTASPSDLPDNQKLFEVLRTLQAQAN
ncbi:redoxin domain-containing protein [Thermogemmatispora onikobensis]|uniref:redoxin domain-containing protein n=1 Tax=Thermogemmatispora onikobensis TaxID=732234 RepID=UPI0008539BD2|nr:redoxin domain-containing protein [Thermogemmatispora onikobensis]